MDILDDIITTASSGEFEKLKELTEKYPEMINKTNNNGLTPLTSALINDRINETEYLLSKYADKKSCMKNGQPALEWAKEQDNNNAAFFLIAWDYLDRLYEASNIWKKHKIKEAYCDVCIARITEEDSTMLNIDEVFTPENNYSKKIIEQVKKSHPLLLENKSTDEIKKTIMEQIKNSSPTGKYFVCEECIEKYFSQIVFGKSKDKVFEIVTRMFEENS
ncbi:MAG: ankyrin repeat domain-containing protein [Spirochaetaceae bacterium]|nr:ankyrin repeat domain-containing protein [Spirochaetaceae bacterium]MCL2705410.1 ankyrin repeat domain-containing protein [Spirochaetaceae bacterium]